MPVFKVLEESCDITITHSKYVETIISVVKTARKEAR
ncbi:hypothetical protein BJV38_000864 [Clostridium beijerinckii]|nr:hypothetical protein [Clostridium beijerinckii]NRZ21986.1 hypothetical protein [Clostridium beijerinckii]